MTALRRAPTAILTLALSLAFGTGTIEAQAPTDRAHDPQRRMILVGDMVVDPLQMPGATRGGSNASPSTFTGLDGIIAMPWPDGRMPVRFAPEVPTGLQAFFLDVCGRWSAVADVECVRATGNEDALEVGNSGLFSGCNSTVGYSPYYRAMNLEDSCWSDSVVLHEIGHSFGLLHEHQRPDRDAFIAIDYANVQSGYAFAFDTSLGSMRGPYDLRSVMHYQWYAFAADPYRPSLTPRGANAPLLYDMGSGRIVDERTLPSDGDARGMRSLYGAAFDIPGAPGALHLVAAAGNTLTLAWSAPTAGAAVQSYRVDVGSDAAFTRIVVSQPLGAGVTSATGSLPNGIAHIRIVPRGAAGDGVPSNTLTLALPGGRIIARPEPPAVRLVSGPANPVALAWQSTGGGAATSYTVVAGTTAGSSDLGVFQVGQATTLAGNVPVDTPIHVRVIAANAAGTAVSEPLIVTVPSKPSPGSPLLQSPLVSGHDVGLAWTAPASGASSYRVRVRFTSDGPVVAEWAVANTSIQFANVPPGTYYVSIAAVIGHVIGPESTPQIVTVQ